MKQTRTETDFFDTGQLRSVAGLGVNVAEVYPNGKCFLKGFFNAVETWRFGQDAEDWRLLDLMVKAASMDREKLSSLEFEKRLPCQHPYNF